MKPHLLVSESPLTEGQDHLSLCGAVVHKSAWVWSDGEIKTGADFLERLGRCCRKCIRARGTITEKPASTLYCYGAVNGEELKQNEL